MKTMSVAFFDAFRVWENSGSEKCYKTNPVPTYLNAITLLVFVKQAIPIKYGHIKTKN
jgi:hypothetical protein